MRNKLIEDLADKWREAEDYFIETEDDSHKWAVKEMQDKCNLTEEEEEELGIIMRGMCI